MASVTQLEIRCQHCRQWFPSSIVVGDDESFDTATLNERTVTCAHCGKATGCDQTAIRGNPIVGFDPLNFHRQHQFNLVAALPFPVDQGVTVFNGGLLHARTVHRE